MVGRRPLGCCALTMTVYAVTARCTKLAVSRWRLRIWLDYRCMTYAYVCVYRMPLQNSFTSKSEICSLPNPFASKYVHFQIHSLRNMFASKSTHFIPFKVYSLPNILTSIFVRFQINSLPNLFTSTYVRFQIHSLRNMFTSKSTHFQFLVSAAKVLIVDIAFRNLDQAQN